MVTQVTSFGRNGISDFIVQRVSGIVVAAYTIFIGVFLLLNPDVQYVQWKMLFTARWVQIFTLLTLLSICAHAWVGMWTIGTDYLSVHTAGKYADTLRLFYQILSIIVLLIYLIWGTQLLWGN